MYSEDPSACPEYTFCDIIRGSHIHCKGLLIHFREDVYWEDALMPQSLSLIDILFVVTVCVLVFNGFKNGAVFSLFHLLSLPIAFLVSVTYGPQFTTLLETNGLQITPLLAYIVVFFGTVLVLHVIGTSVHGILKNIPVLGCGDELAGGIIGFVESWLLWVIFLMVLRNFLQDTPHIPGIDLTQVDGWQRFYNEAITNSLFAKVNSFMVTRLPTHI